MCSTEPALRPGDRTSTQIISNLVTSQQGLSELREAEKGRHKEQIWIPHVVGHLKSTVTGTKSTIVLSSVGEKREQGATGLWV